MRVNEAVKTIEQRYVHHSYVITLPNRYRFWAMLQKKPNTAACRLTVLKCIYTVYIG
jgi:hypothetical protein